MTRVRDRLPPAEAGSAAAQIRAAAAATSPNPLAVAAGDHRVQFYESDDLLIETLTRYIGACLDAGEAGLVIATPSHRARLASRLRASGRDMAAARRQGRYRALDADRLLQAFMVDGEPNRDRFADTVTRLLRRAAAGGRTVRVFGEMVALLWQAGHQHAAIEVEALWNDLQQSDAPPFALLCAYPEALLADDAARGALAAVREQHTSVMPRIGNRHHAATEPHPRALALQQEAHALRVEVAERRYAEERLRASEARYRGLFEASRDGILMLDASTGRISEVNQAAAQLFGSSREGLVGRELWQIGLFPTRESASQAIHVMRIQPAPRWETLPLQPGGGAERLVELSASVVRLEDAELIQCTLRDVSERRKLEREAAGRTAELEAIELVTETALAHASLDDLLRDLMVRMRTVLGVDNVAILLADASGKELVLRHVAGPEEEVVGHVRVPLGRGVAGRIAATRELLIIEDLRRVPVENPFLRDRLRSLMGVPLVVADRLIGVLHVDTTQPHVFTPDEARLLRLVAGRVARMIDRAQLLDEVEQARQAAEERANQLLATFEAIADGVVVFDGSGRLIQMNAAAQQLLGQIGRPEYIASSDRQSRRFVRDGEGLPLTPDEWPVLRVLRGEEITGAQAMDMRIRGAGDRDVDISVSGAPVRDADGVVRGAVCVFRDVTAQRQLERRTHDALQALLAVAGALFDMPEDGVSSATALDAEPQAAVTGAPSPSLEARRLAQLACEVLACQRVGIVAIDPETRVRVPFAIAGFAPEQEAAWWAERASQRQPLDEDVDPEVMARFEAGEAVVVDMTQPPYSSRPNPYGVTTTLVAPMRIGSRLMGLLAVDFGGEPHVFTDQERALTGAVARLAAMVVERERLLRERAEARISALAAQETAQRMNTFLGMAGHEFRTPVTSIKAGVQLAERAVEAYLRAAAPDAATGPLARARPLLQRVDQQANRLTRLIEDILDVARTHAGRLALRVAPGDLVAVVRQAVETQQLTFPDRTISLDTPPVAAILNMDADRIEQVVVNLVTNALKYSPDDQPVSVRVTVEGEVARVVVSDHGPGLAPDVQRQIWEPFYRAHGHPEQAGAAVGLGLGLHICRMIIERHHGQIGVESREGQGATFWFELPLAAALDGAADGAPEPAVEGASGTAPRAVADAAG